MPTDTYMSEEEWALRTKKPNIPRQYLTFNGIDWRWRARSHIIHEVVERYLRRVGKKDFSTTLIGASKYSGSPTVDSGHSAVVLSIIIAGKIYAKTGMFACSNSLKHVYPDREDPHYAVRIEDRVFFTSDKSKYNAMANLADLYDAGNLDIIETTRRFREEGAL